MKIRPATKQEVARFFRAARTRMHSASQLLSDERLEAADEFFVAVVDRRIVGAVCLVRNNGQSAELLTEFVLSDYQGRGIGTKLTRAGIRRLISLGLTPIYIDVASHGMDRTIDRLPKSMRRHLMLNRSYRKYGEVELPES